jgi:hypothetical protein
MAQAREPLTQAGTRTGRNPDFRGCFRVFQPRTPPAPISFSLLTFAHLLDRIYFFTMSDIQGFPHILQKILDHADRATLSVMIRVSTFLRDFTKPFLYPTKLIDPFLLPGTSCGPASTLSQWPMGITR